MNTDAQEIGLPLGNYIQNIGTPALPSLAKH